MATSNLKERVLLSFTILGFLADLITLATFFSGAVGAATPLGVLTLVTIVLFLVLLLDFRGNRESYPFVLRLTQAITQSKVMSALATLALGTCAGLLLMALLVTVYLAIAQPETTNASKRETTAVLVAGCLACGGLMGMMLTGMLIYLSVVAPSFSAMNKSLNEAWVTSVLSRYSGQQSNSPLQFKADLILKEIKPITAVTDKGLNIRIEFIVENRGGAKKIYPHVEYKIAELKHGKYVERVVYSPSTWEVEVEAFCEHPLSFDNTFDATTLLLTKPPNAVKVKLYRSPIG